MRIETIDSPAARRISFGDGATVEVLLDGASRRLAAALVTVAAGAELPEHDHGGSDALLIPLTGRLLLSGRGGEATLTPGTVAFIATGERVSVQNPATSPASMVVCFAPTDFIDALQRHSGAAGQ
jgi:quercetin dioxygenase-like cupin family protein